MDGVLFDHDLLARRRQRAAARWPQHNFLFAEVAERLTDRLADVKRPFAHVLDVSPLDDTLARRLGTQPYSIMSEQLQLAAPPYDLVTSNLFLHWVNDLPGMLVQMRLALKADGLLLAAMMGGETLAELRQCLYEAEQDITGGFVNRFSPLTEVRDMGGLLQRAGFALPVADRETIEVTYAHPLKLLQELRGMAATNMAPVRHPLRRDVLARAMALYGQRYQLPDGRVRATFEIIFLSGWAPDASQPQPLARGSGKISLKDIL